MYKVYYLSHDLLLRMYLSVILFPFINQYCDFLLSFFTSVMEYPVMETGSLFTSGIKRHVKEKRISKAAKLNVSLASKIKTKILSKCY